MTKKVVYVPRNWKVSYTDRGGIEHTDNLWANREYQIVVNGTTHNVTVAGIRSENGRAYIVPKVELFNGFMNTMVKLVDTKYWIDEITEIHLVTSKYVKTKRSIRNEKIDAPIFTFAFDTEKYASQYRISVAAGEFVELAMKDPTDPNKKSRSIYGHIVDVDSDAGKLKFARYVSKRGVRDIYDYTIELDTLLGIYRYNLEVSVVTFTALETAEVEVAAEAE